MQETDPNFQQCQIFSIG